MGVEIFSLISGFETSLLPQPIRKMLKANKGGPPEWLSTHPSGNNRIEEMEKTLPKVAPLYEDTTNHKQQ